MSGEATNLVEGVSQLSWETDNRRERIKILMFERLSARINLKSDGSNARKGLELGISSAGLLQAAPDRGGIVGERVGRCLPQLLLGQRPAIAVAGIRAFEPAVVEACDDIGLLELPD